MATPNLSAGALRFHLTPRSANAKTGPIPVSTSSRATCWDGCPFLKNGCYADAGPLALHWDAVTRGDRGTPWSDFLAAVAALPAGQIWRHNQAGDLYRPGTVTGRKALAQLVEANRGRRGFTYSHHKRTPATVQAFKAATANGFTVNASCETVAGADAAIANGLRAVFVVPSAETRTAWDTPGGNRAVLCPAQRRDGVTCATCQLCQSRPSNVAIAFQAHGTGRRRIESVLAALL
jgi:hypothetical protein